MTRITNRGSRDYKTGQLLGITNRGRRDYKSEQVQELKNEAKGLQIGAGISNRCRTLCRCWQPLSYSQSEYQFISLWIYRDIYRSFIWDHILCMNLTTTKALIAKFLCIYSLPFYLAVNLSVDREMVIWVLYIKVSG